MDYEILHRLERETSASEDVGARRGWIVKSHIGWGGERNILYKGVETSFLKAYFKNLEGKLKRESSKRTIFAGGELGRQLAESTG